MLRSVFAIALMAACHPAPAPTIAHAAPAAVAAPATKASPVRQDFELLGAIGPGPLHEVLATGHECRQELPGPIEGQQMPVPVDGRRLIIALAPDACQRHRDGQPILH